MGFEIVSKYMNRWWQSNIMWNRIPIVGTAN